MVAAVPSDVLGFLIPALFLAIFLVVFRTRRSDGQLCWWIYGWTWLLVAALPLQRLLAPHEGAALFVAWCSATAAAVCFLISSPASRNDSRGIIYTALAVGLPATVFAALVMLQTRVDWLLYLCIATSEIAGAAIIVRRFRKYPLHRIAVTLPFLIFGVWLWFCVAHDQKVLALSVIHAELLTLNILMISSNHPRRTLGFYVTQLGFLGWLVATPAMASMLHFLPIWGYIFDAHQVLGIGMVLLLMEESLVEAQRQGTRFKTIFDKSPHMMWTIDPTSMRLASANEAAARAHGYSLEEFTNLRISDVLDAAHLQHAVERISELNSEPTRSSLHKRKDSTTFPIDIDICTIELEGAPHRLVMGVDVTEREKLQSDLMRRAVFDDMTGLLNRKSFHAKCDHALSGARETGEVVAVASFNIAQFKNVNDTYGDQIGDRCLRMLANCIREQIGPNDLASRTAGDEFKVMLRGFGDTESAESAAEALMRALDKPVHVDSFLIRLSIRMGVAIAPEDGTDGITLRRKALRAMSRARSISGAAIARYSARDDEAAARLVRLENAIREMLHEDSFAVHYQPICRPDGTVKSLEALLRMPHQEMGMISPAEFIHVAEESRLIIPLGQWVFEHVCRQINTWKGQGIPTVPVAVNISALQFHTADFSSNIQQTMEKFQISSDAIVLELTESTVLHNLSETLPVMRAMAAQGICFALDDFGTGYSSLARLREMPVSMLKIDRSFIRKMQPQDALVNAIISLAHALNTEVVAEGVETHEQLAILRGMNCDSVQGFLLSPPVPPDLTADLLTRKRVEL